MTEAAASPATNGVDTRVDPERISPASPARASSAHSPRTTQTSDPVRDESAPTIAVPLHVVTPIGGWSLDHGRDAQLAARPAFHREPVTTTAHLLTQVIEGGQSCLVVLERIVCAEAQVSYLDPKRFGRSADANVCLTGLRIARHGEGRVHETRG